MCAGRFKQSVVQATSYVIASETHRKMYTFQQITVMVLESKTKHIQPHQN